jgi:hypothetical protein
MWLTSGLRMKGAATFGSECCLDGALLSIFHWF